MSHESAPAGKVAPEKKLFFLNADCDIFCTRGFYG